MQEYEKLYGKQTREFQPVLFHSVLRTAMDNKSNQNNPNNEAYWKSRGYNSKPPNWKDRQNENPTMSKAAQDFRSQQLNPNNKSYYSSRRN
ncbi:hypothetical protein GWI33_012306 [Rhynchophorus ferrugineus]|uniref:Uncharacterized protein n=1 Tax=Rhynchophorus ferrugineus TaxID=354439 RepID=A0A834IJ24_RHYFE|nr:hypothetical protein GWI33_012306 [Rhynchophorus ferrugineus]